MIDGSGLSLAYRHMIYDVAIIGAGIGGASLAAHLEPGVSCVLLEAEDRPGYHSTGRSAAFYTETYGGPQVQPLTTASKPWYFNTVNPASETLMVRRRGALHVNWTKPQSALQTVYETFKPLSPSIKRLDASACVERCDILPESDISGGVYDPDCCDIDVASVHNLFLRQAKLAGVELRSRFPVAEIERREGIWHVSDGKGETLQAKKLVNAAGAWADQVASIAGVAPLGLLPKRRTIGVFEIQGMHASSDWPLVLDLKESFYFKPEGQHLLISPADETVSPPCDAQPEIEDIALAASRFEHATGRILGRCHAKWAGLRTFAPDRVPIYGYDPVTPDFFWCAGQGGFGIQTAPAAGALSAALLLGNSIPKAHQDCGITADRYAPSRFRVAA